MEAEEGPLEPDKDPADHSLASLIGKPKTPKPKTPKAFHPPQCILRRMKTTENCVTKFVANESAGALELRSVPATDVPRDYS